MKNGCNGLQREILKLPFWRHLQEKKEKTKTLIHYENIHFNNLDFFVSDLCLR